MKFKSTVKYLGLYGLIPLSLILVGAIGATVLLISTGKDINKNNDWYETPSGIDEEFFVSLGGHEQFVHVRGRDSSNPVLLYLHGGPGVAMSGMLHRVNRPLADYFTLVEWDQRGAGRSRIDDALVSSMSYQRMVDDAVELIEHLQARLDVKQVILVGQSWGSMLGLGIVQDRPDLIAAYVGVGQSLAFNKALDETARLVLAAAERVDDEETIAVLRALPEEWPPASDRDEYFSRIEVIQEPLTRYGTGLHAAFDTDFNKSSLVLDSALSPDIGILEMLVNLELSEEANLALIEDLQYRDFREEFGATYSVPMFIFQGKHDWQTPSTLVKPWFDTLIAPHKEYIVFEHSGHMVNIEEEGKFIFEMINRVRPFGQKR
jgi:pimeloyl-ACP methyl ester carboxylesterase